MPTTADEKTEFLTVVTGDVTIDWNLAVSEAPDGRSPDLGRSQDTAKTYRGLGGSALLARLLIKVAYDLSQSIIGRNFTVRSVVTPSESLSPESKEYHHSYATWSPFAYGTTPPFVTRPKPGVCMSSWDWTGQRVMISGAAVILTVRPTNQANLDWWLSTPPTWGFGTNRGNSGLKPYDQSGHLNSNQKMILGLC